MLDWPALARRFDLTTLVFAKSTAFPTTEVRQEMFVNAKAMIGTITGTAITPPAFVRRAIVLSLVNLEKRRP